MPVLAPSSAAADAVQCMWAHRCVGGWGGKARKQTTLCGVQILEAMHREDTGAGVGDGRVPPYEAGCGSGWAECGPCHKQRFLQYTHADPPDGSASVGNLLHAACHDLFASEAFAKWLLGVTELAPRGMRSQVRRFRPGLDYTVATAGGMGAAVQLEATLCFVSADTEDKAAAWGSDEVGGFQCYILADDDATAAAETYRCWSSLLAERQQAGPVLCTATSVACRFKTAHNTDVAVVMVDVIAMAVAQHVLHKARWLAALDVTVGTDPQGMCRGEEEDDSMISCSAAFNTLNLILRDASLMQFVKYVSAGAPGSRWDIAAAYTTDLADDEFPDAAT